MILIGQYDSPFVRRVGIALTLYGMDFEHRRWSVFGDAEALRAVNPLVRVPVLVLADGTALADSHMILDYLDTLVSASQTLFPRQEPARHRALRIAALACGLGDKALSLFYERRLHADVSPVWVQRCEGQIRSVLARLDAERALRPGPFWFGDTPGHADIALACMLRFTSEAHPGLVDPATCPRISADAAGLEDRAVFKAIWQAFIPPA